MQLKNLISVLLKREIESESNQIPPSIINLQKTAKSTQSTQPIWRGQQKDDTSFYVILLLNIEGFANARIMHVFEMVLKFAHY